MKNRRNISKYDSNKWNSTKINERIVENHIDVHIRNVHEKRKDHICPECNKALGSAQSVISHLKAIHDKVKDLKCEICDFSCSLQQSLTSHLKLVHHKRPEKTLPCPQCPFLASFSSSLKNHIKRVHIKDEDKVNCPHCSYRTSYNDALSQHIEVVHENKREFKCSKCDYSAGRKQTLEISKSLNTTRFLFLLCRVFSEGEWVDWRENFSWESRARA